MTRKGKIPIAIPKGVEVNVSNATVKVKGPKGTLEQEIMPGVIVKVEGESITVSLDESMKDKTNFHGLYHSLIINLVKGTTDGFEKKLEMIGVGYRAAVQGKNLNLQVGFSHPTALQIPEGIEVQVEKNTKVIVKGIDKQKVGQFAAVIRSIRPPEPYQGKGIPYEGEYVRRKAGKARAKA